MLALACVTGVLAFFWPLFLRPGALLGSDSSGRTATPFVMAAIMAVVLALLISELSNHELDVKALAMLGVLTAIGAVVRPLSAGTAGIETVFFLMILAGRVFGPSFGFMLGALTMFASALLTGGVGTWLPYQMLGAGFVGLLPGLLPRHHPLPGSRAEIVMLGGYGFVSAFLYGYLMDFAFWPFAAGLGAGTQGGFDPHASPLRNIHTFLVVNTVTSLGWNLGRALTNVVLVTLLGHPLLRIMRRTARVGTFRAQQPSAQP
ncbi:ECF transporter S component [Propionibacterium cyclohexanicum]|nr:ECF transporter S component [Propionibacterium cyclohexanicum]